MKLGLTWGYWGALPPGNLVELTQEAERLGFDSVWSAEAWGSDAFSPLAYLAAHTSTIKLGTGVVQLSGRTPTAAAMHAITVDHLSQGRLILGLGVSGPQVVEGWYGQPYRKPLARTRGRPDDRRRQAGRAVAGPEHPERPEELGAPHQRPEVVWILHPIERDEHPSPLGVCGPQHEQIIDVVLARRRGDGHDPARQVGGDHGRQIGELDARHNQPELGRQRLGLPRRPAGEHHQAAHSLRLRAQQFDHRALARHQVRVWPEGQARTPRARRTGAMIRTTARGIARRPTVRASRGAGGRLARGLGQGDRLLP